MKMPKNEDSLPQLPFEIENVFIFKLLFYQRSRVKGIFVKGCKHTMINFCIYQFNVIKYCREIDMQRRFIL